MTRFYKVALVVSITSLLLLNIGLTKGLNGVASAQPQNGDNRLIDSQSASGKITGAQRHAFTIEIQQVTPPGAAAPQQDRTSSMTFVVNSSTKTEGKLAVGANADVVYRRSGDKNVAVTVRVTPIA
jgi:hypothetical protein